MASPHLLKTCFDVLHYSGMTRLLAPLCRGRGIIFCLHQVLPNGGAQLDFSPNHQLAISTQFLDAALSHLRVRGYRFLSLDEAVQELRQGMENSAPFAVFTLDDGYRDNMIHAAPVFRKHNCPYMIFVTAGFADGTCEFWWKALEEIIARGEAIEFGGRRFQTGTVAQKIHAWQKTVSHLKSLDEPQQRVWLRSYCRDHDYDLDKQCQTLAMSWGEIRQLSKDPLCSFGAHTLNHYAVARLAEDDARLQMGQSASRLASELNKPVTAFAYPYGDVTDAGSRDFQLAKECGFLASVTTRKGTVFTGHRNHLQALPRVMLSGRYQNLRYLDALMSGVPLALLNGFARLNVT